MVDFIFFFFFFQAEDGIRDYKVTGVQTCALPISETVAFSTAEGGVLCAKCAGPQPPTKLPPQAYRDLVALNDEQVPLPSLAAAHAAAHRRLIARFVRHHLDETRRNGSEPKSSAIDIWERRAWVHPDS